MGPVCVNEVGQKGCDLTLEVQAERIEHFTRRVKELGHIESDLILVILNVVESFGDLFSELTMPGHDWQAFRDRGMTPYARGLCFRESFQAALDKLYPEIGSKLRGVKGLALLIADYGQVEVYEKDGDKYSARKQ